MHSAQDSSQDRSYRALFALPAVGRLLLGMQIARIAQSMVGVTTVLFALALYRSPALAGLATFFSIFPGLLVSPIAGALLDRHGRTRLVILDYVMALASLTTIGVLAFMEMLSAPLLMVIATIASLTAPLSNTGLRSVLPMIVPRHLWERVNAFDSTGYILASVVGPPLAASLFVFSGGPMSFVAIGSCFGIAALVLGKVPDPRPGAIPPGRLLADSWKGVVYTWRNPTLRGLGFSISVLNLAGGAFTIIIPVIVLQLLQLPETVVGIVFAIQGVTGVASAFFFGRRDSRGREKPMLIFPMIASGAAMGLLLFDTGLASLVALMAITGVLTGPLDIALFTLRQRRTDPEWTGRAFAVSMAFNYVGTPVGSALAGIVAARSLTMAILFGIAACIASGILAAAMIPRQESGG